MGKHKILAITDRHLDDVLQIFPVTASGEQMNFRQTGKIDNGYVWLCATFIGSFYSNSSNFDLELSKRNGEWSRPCKIRQFELLCFPNINTVAAAATCT